MKKMRILLDMDSIVCETLSYWLDHIAETTGIRAQIEDIVQWHLHKCPPLDKLPESAILARLQLPGFIVNIPPMKGAPEAIKKLMDDGHEVYIVTARHGPQSMPETLEWMKKHLPFMSERQIIFCGDKELISGDFLIDDKPDTLVRYCEVHPWAFVATIDYPYNRFLDPKDVERFQRGDKCWSDIYSWISFMAHSYTGTLKCKDTACRECA